MTTTNENVNYEKVIAEQLIRIGDILTAAFQGQLMQYNNTIRLAHETEQVKEAYNKLSQTYNDLKSQEQKENNENNNV
jgi:hypothetical protein